jgi:CubicO group peptidase (beta-lactamase class C family)
MRGISLVALCVVLAACTPEPPPPSGDTGVESHGMPGYLDGLVETRQFRGAVEVRRGDEVLLSQGFGHADVARDVPGEPDTRFRIASVTKQFTALAVLMLQEDGELQVSDLLCTHLPDCPPAWRAITIEHLLTHTAGLWDYNDMTDAEGARYLAEFGDRPTPAQLIQTFVHRPLGFTPGTSWKYNNCGYDLLGVLVERLSGHTYGQFLADRIFAPLRMSDTAYQPDQRPSDRDAVGYRDWATPADTMPDAVNFASGGMYSTAPDLTRWNQFLLTGTPAIVEPGTLERLLQPRVDTGTDTGTGTRYGYGIETQATGDATVHFHSGAVNGFRSHSEIHPGTNLSIVVLSNLETVEPRRIADNLALLSREP